MKKLNVAIIGQGRSGQDIHGAYFCSERNQHFTVKYVVDLDPHRREVAKAKYAGCEVFADYRELFCKNDVDLVVNASFSEQHYSVSLDLLEHGFNVLCEKPMGASDYECRRLIATAEKKGVLMAVFQQSFFAPYYVFAKETAESGLLGEIQQISVAFNGFSRRWDWQTLQKKCAGGLYNTGPHPVGLALGFLDFDKNTRLVFSKLGRAMTSGDADDYAKLILQAPSKPVVDVEVSSCDAFCDYNIKIQGSRGCLKSTTTKCELVYFKDEENPAREVVEGSLRDAQNEPVYCKEELVKHRVTKEFDGTAFDVGTSTLYEEVFQKLTAGRAMTVTAEMAADIIKIIAQAHAENPLTVQFL